MTKPRKLSKASRDKLDGFSEAAKSHGWHEDAGYGRPVVRAEKNYKLAYTALERRLLYLEKALAKAKKTRYVAGRGSPR